MDGLDSSSYSHNKSPKTTSFNMNQWSSGSAFSLFSTDDMKRLLHPQSKPRVLWSLVSIIFVTFDLITIPLSAFKHIDDFVPWFVQLLSGLFWSFDILMTFRTGVFVRGKLELSSKV